MSELRSTSYDAILAAIEASPLPASKTVDLREAVAALYAERPNAMDKIRQPLGRALRNPMFPEIWNQAVSDIPGSSVYAPLREASQGIADFVAAARR